MTILRTTLLLLLLASASPLYAAELHMSIPSVEAGTVFSIPVTIDMGTVTVNVVEGSLIVPDGITVDSISTNGSVLTLFTKAPAYVASDTSIEFTGGTPSGFSGTQQLLFTVHAHASAPGSYTLTPNEIFAYLNDGKGTRVTIPGSAVTFSVGKQGSVPSQTPLATTSTTAPIPSPTGSGTVSVLLGVVLVIILIIAGGAVILMRRFRTTP